MKLAEYLRKYHTNPFRLAQKAGVNASSISRMVNGPRQSVSPENAAKISAATDGLVTVQEILFPNGIPDGARMAPPRKTR